MSTDAPATNTTSTTIAVALSVSQIETVAKTATTTNCATKQSSGQLKLLSKPETSDAPTTTTVPYINIKFNNFQQQKQQKPIHTANANRPLSKNAVQMTSSLSSNPAPNLSLGQAVSARLMDMGKRLLDASREGHTDHVRQLVVNSGAPFTSDWLGTTALHLAAQNGHTEIAEILLRGGVNRDARTKLERTALHLAAQGGWLEVVDLLLMHGSDVNARDMLRMTPLHWAVERGHIRVAERLLFSGAELNAKSKFQLTPIDIARNSESYAIMELLKSWIKKNDNFRIFNDLASSFCESHDMLDNVDFHLTQLEDMNQTSGTTTSNTTNTTLNKQEYLQRATILDISEPCIDLVELEWNTLRLKPDFFLSNDETIDDDDELDNKNDDEDEEEDDNEDEEEPKVEYLMKVVEELQKENRQLRQRVEQLSTTIQ